MFQGSSFKMPEGHSLPLFSHAIETSPHYRPCAFSSTPAEIAAQLCHREGFVWMDSSLPTPGAISVLTAEPVAAFHGHIDRDWEKVRTALRIPRSSAGGLYGWVGYDGHFTFGIYPHGLVYHHDTAKWYEFGDFKLPNPPTGAPALLSAVPVTHHPQALPQQGARTLLSALFRIQSADKSIRAPLDRKSVV